MKITEFYREINRVIGDLTPIGVDCGQLCNGACCEGDDETGMYLFPGEERMYEGDDGWFEIMESDFEYAGKNAKLFVCKEPCDREKRPLGCRIFPLLPYINVQGEMSVILDPRGKGLCPLCIMDKEHLDREFCEKVEYIGRVMMRFDETREYLFALSRLADEFSL